MDQTRKKVTLRTLLSMKEKGVPASFITAYDYPSSVFANQAGIDMILVGDSGGMTTLGYKNTMPVTMDEMLHFSKAVCRGNKYAFVVGDMPFMSYQVSNESAVINAGRFMSEASCDAVKLEVHGPRMQERIEAVVDAGIPVMAHLGLTPQSISMAGGYRVYGKNVKEINNIIQDAKSAQQSGASFILLEAMPSQTAAIVRQRVTIPVYGIGAGKEVDGQLLILHDVIGSFIGDINPKFAKQYASVGSLIKTALECYNLEVKNRQFPKDEHCYPIDEQDLAKILQEVEYGHI